MTEKETGGLESAATDESEGLDTRDVRALTECMTAVETAPGLYSVVGENGGGEYRVDVVEGACTCPDNVYRGVECKHIKRVAFATGAREIPAWVTPAIVDDALGAALDAEPVWADADADADADEGDDADEDGPDDEGDAPEVATDGGVATIDEDVDADEEDLPELTYHYEPPEQGGERYVRCSGCGAEVLCSLGADEEPIHYDDCPRSRDGYPRTGGHTEA